jgi:peptidoglycan-associated lipoprotein
MNVLHHVVPCNGANGKFLKFTGAEEKRPNFMPQRGGEMTRLFPLFIIAAVLIFQGCAPKQASVPLSQRTGVTTGKAEKQEAGLSGTEAKKGDRGSITEEDLSAKSSDEKGGEGVRQTTGNELAAQLQDIYFDLDSYTVRSEDLPILKDLAAWLTSKPSAKLTIEGHCDERGTTDYNLALGQKRAEAARAYLSKMGVSDKRLKAVSYGKEAPLNPGHTEEAWKKNRRVHFASP